MIGKLAGYGPIDTVVCDIDGVVVLGADPIPGVGEALHRLRAGGLVVIFATNNSTKAPATIARTLRETVGFDPGPDSVVNSGVAAARFLQGKAAAVYVLGADGLRDTLRGFGITVVADWREADTVLTGLDFDVTYQRLAGAVLAVQHGAAFYATNSDATFPTADGEQPGAGAITAVVERATGLLPIVCGKPFAPMRTVLQDYGGDRPVMVGDRPETDLALGKNEGWATALVLTGVTKDPKDVPKEYTPDLVLDSLAELPDALGID
jgi:HAD superfamily hydrolase (TIGR01450 family)